ncbi:IclR family transcriptional regulator [Nocardia carnea]|uniref:IclR family transcriptional regulator n=1 Tax=Nocardia carnea TaxID=37328 RepID=UPI0024541895|nr:IclR family transcriptional regulator [Nocardia carnea]
MIHIPVKTLSGLLRGLHVVEAIAAAQPVGLTELCRTLGEDKSAMQRVLATLHEAGWIRPLPESPPRWELSAKIVTMAGQAHSTSSLLVRARPVLAALRDTTGETSHLALLDGGQLVVATVADGTHTVRTALPIGQVHPPETSAAGRAIFAHLPPTERAERAETAEALLSAAEYDRIRTRGWSLCEGAVQHGSTSIGAAIFDITGAPQAAIVVSAPDTRLTPGEYAHVGALVRAAARRLSGTTPETADAAP